MALQRVAYPDPARLEQALRRGTAWVLSMQNRDGGWGAFDRNNDSTFLTRVPFADHNAMIDPSTGDLTAPRFGISGPTANGPLPIPNSARRAISSSGTRPPKARGMAAGESTTFTEPAEPCAPWKHWACRSNPRSQQAVEWLRGVQNADGGFGESCASYDDPKLKARAPSTASQTAWASRSVCWRPGTFPSAR